ncbi:MAG: hypothetical protein Q7S26_01430 [bacterium]|nr:hypothetical protein [bacterium]
MPHYTYGLLRTDVSSEAQAHNNTLLGKWTLGIEVTDPELARLCGFGNIDPQHGRGGAGKSSAIEQALGHPLPPDGAALVTIRPDKDSFGAMAVLMLRAEGRMHDIEFGLVAWVGTMDQMGFHNARSQYPDLYEKYGDKDATDALQVVTRSPDLRLTMEERVRKIGDILTGEMSRREMREYVALKPQPLGENPDFDVEMHGQVAFVTAAGKYHAARDWANRRYTVAIIFDPQYRDETQERDRNEPYRRWCVIRQRGVFDRHGFEEALNKAEATARSIPVCQLTSIGCKWGGPTNIVVSPKGQGHETRLSEEQIITITREHADSGIVT